VYAEKTITYVCPEINPQDCVSAVHRLTDEFPIKFNTLGSIGEIFPLLSDPKFNTDVISIDIEHLCKNDSADAYQLIETLRTLLNCTVMRPPTGKPKKRDTKILAVIGETTNIEFVRELHKLVDGFTMRLGEKFTFDDIRKECVKILEEDFTMPHKVSEMLKKEKKSSEKSSAPRLTTRQQQIYNLIVDKGASNKTIGRMLNISESTVKLHMTTILKKYGVRSRTQLAVFAKKHKNSAPE
jgi:DNA-binding NarL/FixJ family response regulator